MESPLNGTALERISKEIPSHTKSDPSIPNAFDVEVEKEVKRNKLNRDMKICGTNTLKTPINDVQNSSKSTEAEVEKKMKKKKSQKDSDGHAQQTKGEKSPEKKSKRKPEREEIKFEVIDDVETPFMDLILSKEGHEVAPDAKLVGELSVDHSRKKKKKKKTEGIITGQEALQHLPPISEVGTGGLSTWGD